MSLRANDLYDGSVSIMKWSKNNPIELCTLRKDCFHNVFYVLLAPHIEHLRRVIFRLIVSVMTAYMLHYRGSYSAK